MQGISCCPRCPARRVQNRRELRQQVRAGPPPRRASRPAPGTRSAPLLSPGLRTSACAASRRPRPRCASLPGCSRSASARLRIWPSPRLEHRLDLVERHAKHRHHRHPRTRSPGAMTIPSIATGTLISPGPFLYGPRCVMPAENTGKLPGSLNVARIPDRAVDHHPGHAALGPSASASSHPSGRWSGRRLHRQCRAGQAAAVAFHPIGAVLRQAGVPELLAGRLDPAQQRLLNAVMP